MAVRLVAMLAVTAIAAFGAACGDDDEDDASSAAADVERRRRQRGRAGVLGGRGRPVAGRERGVRGRVRGRLRGLGGHRGDRHGRRGHRHRGRGDRHGRRGHRHRGAGRGRRRVRGARAGQRRGPQARLHLARRPGAVLQARHRRHQARGGAGGRRRARRLRLAGSTARRRSTARATSRRRACDGVPQLPGRPGARRGDLRGRAGRAGDRHRHRRRSRARSRSWAPPTSTPATSPARPIGEYAKDDVGLRLRRLRVAGVRPPAVDANKARMGGYRKGFQAVCRASSRTSACSTPTAPTRPERSSTDVLTALPGQHKIVVVAINDDGMLGALAAAKTAGREGDIYLSGQGADPSAHCEIKNNPNWIADAGVLPGALRRDRGAVPDQGGQGRDDPEGPARAARADRRRTTSTSIYELPSC